MMREENVILTFPGVSDEILNGKRSREAHSTFLFYLILQEAIELCY